MVVGISMVKDEADIVGETVGHMFTQVDHVIVADNGSTDGTREILVELGVEVRDDPEVGYFQSRKMSALAVDAAKLGAEWVLPFDADEFWYSPFGRIADVLGDQPAAICQAPNYNHVATALDPAGPPIERMGWRMREPLELPKVACRPVLPVRIHQGNHGASYDCETELELLSVRHFPYRSPEQFVSKVRNGAAAYAATDLPQTHGQHWRDYGALLRTQGEEALHEVFRRWWWHAEPESNLDLVFDPALAKVP